MKCIVGTYDSKASTDCTSGLDRCYNYTTVGVSTSTSYSCVTASVMAASGITDNKCTTISGFLACLCDTDDCNSDASSGAQTQSGLKCHLGTSKDTAAALATSMDCTSTMDRCTIATNDGNTVWACMSAATATASGFKDEGCSTVGSITQCLCKTDGCNSATTVNGKKLSCNNSLSNNKVNIR